MNLEHYLTSLNLLLDSTHQQTVELFAKGGWLLTINEFLPYVGIGMVLFVMFVKRFRTDGATISSILHLYLIMFMMQIWADDASLIFSPSRQSVLARLLILLIAAITLIFSCRTKKRLTSLKNRLQAEQTNNAKLKAINEHLKGQLRR